MKQQGLITTLIIIAVVVVGLYFAWDLFLKEMIEALRAMIMGKEVVETVSDIAS